MTPGLKSTSFIKSDIYNFWLLISINLLQGFASTCTENEFLIIKNHLGRIFESHQYIDLYPIWDRMLKFINRKSWFTQIVYQKTFPVLIPPFLWSEIGQFPPIESQILRIRRPAVPEPRVMKIRSTHEAAKVRFVSHVISHAKVPFTEMPGGTPVKL